MKTTVLLPSRRRPVAHRIRGVAAGRGDMGAPTRGIRGVPGMKSKGKVDQILGQGSRTNSSAELTTMAWSRISSRRSTLAMRTLLDQEARP